jgi:hypothetical protein
MDDDNATRAAGPNDLETVAKAFVQRLVETANDHDPEREAAFQKQEDEREARVTELLRENRAKRQK